MKIYFQALKIVLNAVGNSFICRTKMFCIGYKTKNSHVIVTRELFGTLIIILKTNQKSVYLSSHLSRNISFLPHRAGTPACGS